MQMRRLGDSDLSISRVGFGAWAIGGGQWVFGWGPQDDAESIAAIQYAVERGVNWIDTAAVYGLGRSEEVVRRAVANIPSARRPYIFTKCSLAISPSSKACARSAPVMGARSVRSLWRGRYTILL